ncbi:hypothetical protein GCM10009566_48550 [Streptomyces murinus]|uniref:Short-subunit dehydrogenase n=1 Tax=Streptomyces murinus TaxID=33900 RepID=A0A7W3RJR4_STRMR|nr:short-subunit dehydrogenase [Streptomyces murinus]
MMSTFCASKAGVEAFVHALRAEVAHRGVAMGIAYPACADTDMIRDAERFVAMHQLRVHMPRPLRTIQPTDAVAARPVRAVERRRTAVYVPSWLRCLQPVRCALPPVVARVTRREPSRLDAGQPL